MRWFIVLLTHLFKKGVKQKPSAPPSSGVDVSVETIRQVLWDQETERLELERLDAQERELDALYGDDDLDIIESTCISCGGEILGSSALCGQCKLIDMKKEFQI